MFKDYLFYVVGDSPLLMHSPRSMTISGGRAGKRKKIPLPEEEAEMGTYRDDKGYLVFPTSGFRKAFLRAMSGYKVGKKALRTLLSHVRTDGEWAYLVHPQTKKKIKNYKIDIRRAVIQRSAVWRARPMLEEWATEIIFRMNAEIAGMDEEALLKQSEAILNEAGQTIGVGDYRLEREGWFGMFHVEKSEIR